MGTERTLRELSEIDSQLNNTLRIMTPVSHGEDEEHHNVMGYMDMGARKVSPLSEKMDYATLFGAHPEAVVSVTEEDVRHVKDAAMMSKLGRFNQWIGRRFSPYENPANREVLKKLYPEWFSTQQQAIEDWHDLKRRVETLQVLGPQNKEDLFLLWKLNGEKDLDLARKLERTPGIRRGTEDDTKEEATRDFIRGIFNRHEEYEVASSLARAGVLEGGPLPPEDLHSSHPILRGHKYT